MNLCKAAALLVSVCAFSAQAQVATPYLSGETRGQVVNADSGEPIEGAVVVARWEWQEYGLSRYGGSYNNVGNTIHIGEAITGKDGRFAIAGWGPTMKTGGKMEEDMPRLLAFKSGYEPLEQDEKVGTTLRLKKFAGEPKAYAQLILRFQEGRHALSWTRDENSTAIPTMVMALYRERARLGADGTAILGADRMPGRSGEGRIEDLAGRTDGIIWIEWTMRRVDGTAGTRRVVQTMRSRTHDSNSPFYVSPWRLPGPQVAGWEIDPAVDPLVRAYVTGHHRSADVRWDEKGGRISVTKLDGSRDSLLAELREQRKEIEAQLAQGERAEAFVLQEAMLSNFQFECRKLTPDLQSGLCFDAKSEVERAVYAADRRGVIDTRTAALPAQSLPQPQARPQPTRPVGGFTIEPVAQ